MSGGPIAELAHHVIPCHDIGHFTAESGEGSAGIKLGFFRHLSIIWNWNAFAELNIESACFGHCPWVEH
jgi:hypothetical protein